MQAFANVGDQREHVRSAGFSGVNEKIGMAVADLRVADGVALQAQLIDHAPCGRSGRIFENAARTFLTERLAGAPFLVADTNPLENFAEWFGGKFQLHREHHIIRRK